MAFLFGAAATSFTKQLSPDFIAQRNAEEPFATFSTEAHMPHHIGGCYHPSPPVETAAFSFTDQEILAANSPVSIDWRKHGAVGPVQQQHPFGTCWAFSMVAVTEAINVIQGKQPFQKLSEQMVVSCVPEKACGDNSDVLWSWAYHHTGGKFQTEDVYPYNRTCNFFREQQLSPDGTTDGYPGKCTGHNPPPEGPCPPCPGISRLDGTPPCGLDESKGFSTASVQGWGFVSPHGLRGKAEGVRDVTRMVAALLKYGPAQIGIDASCLAGYTGGIITNCPRTIADQDHAVAIVGADTDPATGIDYWIVRNSWNSTFGEGGYFRMQRNTMQMGVFGGYFGCYHKDCMIDP